MGRACSTKPRRTWPCRCVAQVALARRGTLAAGPRVPAKFYAESYWKAALFLAVEVAAIGVSPCTNDKKGNDQTSFYQDFANGHWSVVKYAQYAQTLAPSGKTYTTGELPAPKG